MPDYPEIVLDEEDELLWGDLEDLTEDERPRKFKEMDLANTVQSDQQGYPEGSGPEQQDMDRLVADLASLVGGGPPPQQDKPKGRRNVSERERDEKLEFLAQRR